MEAPQQPQYGVRSGAEEFPLMVVLSIIYPCNFGCPNCPYTDGNSEIRTFYRERQGELFPVPLWQKIAAEAGPHHAWLRCTGGGEPMLHPHMVDMIEFAKEKQARVWLNTNGSMFGPLPAHRRKLERVISAGIDLIEFSMDAGDPETYAKVRPPRGGPPDDPQKWWDRMVGNVRAALELRKKWAVPIRAVADAACVGAGEKPTQAASATMRVGAGEKPTQAASATTRVVVSIIRQEFIEGKLDQAIDFWLNQVGVDDVITRKFLSWDDNTHIDLSRRLDQHLYAELPTEKKEPCVWPFERLNVDTLGRIALCGQDISFRTAELFPNANDVSIKEIWQGEMFNWYRKMHLEGRGAECWPCRGCSAWLAGIRDWHHGWLRVLQRSGEHLREVMQRDLGVEVEVYQPRERKAG